MQTKIPVLFDTDIGSDIDDAVALAYLLGQPRCELLGITTVSGDVARRAALAQVICASAGRADIPIHCGASNVLYNGPGQPHVPQYAAIADIPHRTDWPAATAIEFMRRTIRSRPGEITLLSVGPFTNLALLFAVDPEIPRLLKAVVSMAGWFFGGTQREWNCTADPMSTFMAYNARPPRHLSIGLDVTLQCCMSCDHVRRRFTSPTLRLVNQMAEIWFRERPKITFHDPLAAAVLFRPELCQYQRGYVRVTAEGAHGTLGMTTFAPWADGPHEVASSVDSDAFFREYFTVTAGETF